MAQPNTVEVLTNAVNDFRQIDMDIILRPHIGEVGLSAQLSPSIGYLQAKLPLFVELALFVSDHATLIVATQLRQLVDQVHSIAKQDHNNYMNNRETIRNSFLSSVETIRHEWPHFAIAWLEQHGLFTEDLIQKQREELLVEMKKTHDDLMKELNEEKSRVITETEKWRKSVEEQTQQTAARVAVKDAQEQFSQAGKHNRFQVCVWAILVVILLALLAFIVRWMWTEQPLDMPKLLPHDLWKWYIVYHAGLRLIILTTTAAVIAFGSRILRAHMHMYEHNLHRQRVTNSMSAFVVSAHTPEQQDAILGRLVDAVAAFGTSGLLNDAGDDSSKSLMSVDSLLKTIHQTKGE